MQIRLFHKTNSRSQRIVWLLEELQLDYELIFCDSAALNPPLQQADHPHRLGKFPTLQIHHNASLEVITLAETAAIADYLSYLYNDLAISKLTAPEVIQYYYWKNFTEATFMPDLALKQIFAAIVSKTPLPVRFVSRLFKLGFDRGYLNHILQVINLAWRIFYYGFHYRHVQHATQNLKPSYTFNAICYSYKVDRPFNVHARQDTGLLVSLSRIGPAQTHKDLSTAARINLTFNHGFNIAFGIFKEYF